jgi:hypothetical protein
METSTIDLTDRAGAHRRGAAHWLRRLRGGAAPAADARLVEELERELALLREEHARLAVSRQRERERPAHERVRELLPFHQRDGHGGADAWELLTDCLLLRDGLIEACRELEAGMRETRERLEALLPQSESEQAEAALHADLESAA